MADAAAVPSTCRAVDDAGRLVYGTCGTHTGHPHHGILHAPRPSAITAQGRATCPAPPLPTHLPRPLPPPSPHPHLRSPVHPPPPLLTSSRMPLIAADSPRVLGLLSICVCSPDTSFFRRRFSVDSIRFAFFRSSSMSVSSRMRSWSAFISPATGQQEAGTGHTWMAAGQGWWVPSTTNAPQGLRAVCGRHTVYARRSRPKTQCASRGARCGGCRTPTGTLTCAPGSAHALGFGYNPMARNTYPLPSTPSLPPPPHTLFTPNPNRHSPIHTCFICAEGVLLG